MSLAWSQTSPPASPPAPTGDEPQTSVSKEFNQLAKYEGQTVRGIEFRGITGTNPEMLRTLVVQKTGAPLDRRYLRDSMLALYATGRFASLQVEADTSQGNGLTLVFVVTENYFYGDINVDGAPKKGDPRPHQLIDAAKLDLGQVFLAEGVEHAIERMKKVMADNGYYNAAISYQLKPHEQTRQMDIDFHVVPGRTRTGGRGQDRG